MAIKKNQKVNKTKIPREKTSKKIFINTICIVFLSLILVGSVCAFVIVQSVLADSHVADNIDGLSSENSSRLFDRDGELITTLSSKSGFRESIKYEQIPQVVIDSFLAVEDSRYFKHNGFDFPRFMKSGMNNISAGGIVQGGSTLTMQLVDVSLGDEVAKANYGFQEKLGQKIQEIFKSMEIESILSKEKIMINYLNEINFGGPARGIQKGAQYYFGKNVEQLTLSEAAFLAGVINAPGAYNPYDGLEIIDVNMTVNHYEKAIERRNQVINLMEYHGYLSKEEAALAKSTELSFQLNGIKNFETEKNRSFVDAAVREVRLKSGDDPYTTPMDIYTTMDLKAQAVSDALCNGENVPFPDDLFQTGFAAINNQTGEVLSLGGGRSYDGKQDRATINSKQPGSTAKPILDYAPAFEYLGYSTEHVIEDGPVSYPDENHTMYNYSKQFRGDITIKQAVGNSLNIPAYTTMKEVVNKVGVKKVVEIINNMGFNLKEKDFTLGDSIGGGALDVTPLQLSGAYAALANKGNYIEPYTVKKVVYQDEEKKEYTASSEKQRIFSEETAYLTSYLLKDAVDNMSYGTLVNSLKSNYPVYGKSGTTSYGDEAAQYGFPEGVAKDKWMVGYTNKYTVSCWAGYDKPIAGQNTWLTEQKIVANVEGTVVKSLLDSLTKGEEVGAIPQPGGVVDISHIQGLFPYATAANNDGALMVTGLINKKFIGNLTSVYPDPLSELASLNVSQSGSTLNIEFTPYPDPSKLVMASGTKVMTAGGISVTGRRIFDKSFLFGPVQYKYDIALNGVNIKSGGSGTNSISEQISPRDGDEIKVCGYYGYGNSSDKSSSVCKTIKGVSDSITVKADFDKIFESTASYASAKYAVDAYMKSYLPDVLYEISASTDTSVSPGKLDSASTLKSGVSVKANKDTYYIYIGKEK